MKPGFLVEHQHAVAGDADAGPQRSVLRIGERNHGIEAVVAALQLDQDQQIAVALGALLPREGRMDQETQPGGADTLEKIASVHGLVASPGITSIDKPRPA